MLDPQHLGQLQYIATELVFRLFVLTSTPLNSVQVTGLTSVGDINDELKGRANFGKGHGTGTAYDEDEDEDPRGGQRVQCAQQ